MTKNRLLILESLFSFMAKEESQPPNFFLKELEKLGSTFFEK